MAAIQAWTFIRTPKKPSFDSEKFYMDMKRNLDELNRNATGIREAFQKELSEVKQKADTAEFLAHSAKMDFARMPKELKIKLYRPKFKKKDLKFPDHFAKQYDKIKAQMDEFGL